MSINCSESSSGGVSSSFVRAVTDPCLSFNMFSSVQRFVVSSAGNITSAPLIVLPLTDFSTRIWS